MSCWQLLESMSGIGIGVRHIEILNCELIFPETDCVTDFDQQSEMIIFKSNLTTAFEADIIF